MQTRVYCVSDSLRKTNIYQEISLEAKQKAVHKVVVRIDPSPMNGVKIRGRI